MKRWIQTLGLVAVMALPGIAFAQNAGGGWQNNPSMARPSASGIIRGTAVGVDLPEGVLFVRTAYDVVGLRATPSQLAGINPGDLVQFPYDNYLGNLWLSPQVGGASAAFSGVYGNEGRYTGPIEFLNKGVGLIVIDGQPFRIHPAQLQQLVPGQFVSLRFVSVGPVEWVTTISPVGQRGGGGR